jgi:nucleoside-diphosphate-sugar epimerase
VSRVALTGGTGYVGSIIADGLPGGATLTRLVRRPSKEGDLAWSLDGSNASLKEELSARGVTDLVHAAWDMGTSSRGQAQRICVNGSLDLLREAKAAGVSRFIFISTISAFDDARSIYGQTKREVETAVLAAGGLVLRLGLVHGSGDGGMFGKIQQSVDAGRFVPMIGAGEGLQYLLDAESLQLAIRRALAGALDAIERPVLLADERPVRFRDLVQNIARTRGRRPILVPVPWRLLYFGLSGLERLGFRPPIRSDSVTSFVHANPAPDFTTTRALRSEGIL